MPLIDSIKLIKEYGSQLDWFIPELIQEREKLQIQKDLNIASINVLVHSTGSKKGNQLFNEWRRGKITRLEELDESKLTVFERLQRRKGKGSNTLFDKLKYWKGE